MPTQDIVRGVSLAAADGQEPCAAGLESTIDVYRGTGERLPAALALKASRRMGQDVSRVRVHTDALSRLACRILGARAFAYGNHVFFAPGEFAPETEAGFWLLAHELAHTIQQQGDSVPPGHPAERARVTAGLEAEAWRTAVLGGEAAPPRSRVAPMVLCEPTYPRRTTLNGMLRLVETVLTLSRDPNSTDETVRKWSRVWSNFPAADTAGSLARKVWTYLFLRHFADPDPIPGVESAHARYFYSHSYRWIDGQHFFAFIDFAERAALSQSAQDAFNSATRQGIDIERKQQRIRDYVVLQRPREPNPVGLMQVRPPNTPMFRAPVAVAGGVAQLAAEIYGEITLGGTQGELFSLLNGTQRQKLSLDSAKSAYSYEDIISNQLGTRFLFRYGPALNRLGRGAIEHDFRSNLYDFFVSIGVEDKPASVDELARQSGLPNKERMLAPTAHEDDVRNRHPELFQMP